MNITHDTFSHFIERGYSAIPVVTKTKRPIVPSWKPFQERLPSAEEVANWHLNGVHGVAIVCGEVSGNLLMFDFDNHDGNAAQHLNDWCALVEERFAGLTESAFVIESTQRKGFHVICRIEGAVPPNRKLALADVGGKPTCFIETRGEGGYFLCAPTEGYEIQSGSFDRLSVAQPLSSEIVEYLFFCATELSEYVEDAPSAKHESRHDAAAVQELAEQHQAQQTSADGEKPGEHFNRDGYELMCEVLFEAGWDLVGGTSEKTEHWRRPGKNEGISATYNFQSSGKFIVFSTNAHPFDTNGTPRAFSKFAVYALLRHGGDFRQAAHDLYDKGFGARLVPRERARANGQGRTTSNRVLSDEDRAAKAAHLPEFECNEPGNVARFVYWFGDRVRHDHTSGSWRIYNGRKWELDQKRNILNLAEEMVGSIGLEIAQSDHTRRESLAKHLARSNKLSALKSTIEFASANTALAMIHDEFDADPHVLPLANCTINLKTWEVYEHRAEDYVTACSPAEYKPLEDCPRWRAFLERTFDGKQSLIAFVQRAVGLSLTGDTSPQKLFFAYGSGANGKSVFFRVLELLMGDYCKKAAPEMLMSKPNEGIPNDIADLRGARVVIGSEIQEGRRLDERKVKDLTGGDKIKARFLHREFFEYAAQFKLWLYGNHKPNIRGTDNGIWRRICLIPFTVTIPEDERRPLEELLAEFKEELSGILNWALEGLQDFQANGLMPPDEVRNATDSYRNEQDSLGAFLDTHVEEREGAKMYQKELYALFKKWCEETGEYPLKNRDFMNKLRERGFRAEAGSGNKNVWIGLSAKVPEVEVPF